MSTFVGIDLGGTKVAAALLSTGEPGPGEGRLSEPIQHPTELGSSDRLVDQLAAIVEEVRDAAGGPQIDGVGIGVPSVVDFESGRVVDSVNIPLTNVPLRSVLGERLGTQIYVDNDATVAALAEAHDPELRLVSRNLVILTIGTGVGGGLVLNGRIYRGSTGGAAEVGHTLIGMPIKPAVGALPGFPEDLPEDFPPAGVSLPQPGSLEALGAGHALDNLTARGGIGRHGIETVEAARNGSPEAQAILRRWAHAIGIGIANAINWFDPEEVVIGGGAAAAADLFLDEAERFAEGYIHPGLRGHAHVRLARFGARAGVMGAALLASHEYRDAAVLRTGG